MEYKPGDRIRSCCGCLTFQCVGKDNPEEGRMEFFWSLEEESSIDGRCCVNCEGLTYPEGSQMGAVVTETGICETEVKTTCIYNPATKRGEVTEDHNLKKCCLDADGLHPISTEVLDPATCSVRECLGVSNHQGHQSPYWKTTQVFPACDCCEMNGTMIPPGGWILTDNNKVNLTCCEGKLLVEKVEELSHCKVESLTFQLDTSGSMRGSISVWKPMALSLLEQMTIRNVDIEKYHLFSYVTQISSILETQNATEFKSVVQNYNTFSGGRELTFAGLKHALSTVKKRAFVCVWSDEIGDDTTNSTLEQEILSLKAQTKSVIFFMMIPRTTFKPQKPSKIPFTTPSTGGHPTYPIFWQPSGPYVGHPIGYPPSPSGYPLVNGYPHAPIRYPPSQIGYQPSYGFHNAGKRAQRDAEENGTGESISLSEETEDNNPEDLPGKKRFSINDIEARFSNIGHVMDIRNDPNVVSKIIEIMKKEAICNN